MDSKDQEPTGRFVRSGKVKDIYAYDGEHLLFHFTDRVSAFDVVLPTSIPKKGEALCKMGAYWFETLGVPNHMVKLEGPNMMVVRKLKMIMVECIVRGYLYGSLFERTTKGEVSLSVPNVLASKLPSPCFDPTKVRGPRRATFGGGNRRAAPHHGRGAQAGEGLDDRGLREDVQEG